MFKDAIEFSQHIEETALETGRTPLEVLIQYIEDNDISFEMTKQLLSQSLLEKLQKNGEELGILRPEKNTLTVFFEEQ